MLSLDGHQYNVLVYDYDNNFIKAQEVSDLKDKTIVETVQKIFDKMEENGHTPMLNVTDNQAARPFKSVFEDKTVQMASRGATQSQSKCGGGSDTDVQESSCQ